MHIYFDHQIFALQRLGGISRYFVELAERLERKPEVSSTTIIAPLYINSYLTNSTATILGRKIHDFPGKHHILPLINRFSSGMFLKNAEPDILHETYYTNKPLEVKVPRVLTVYDMIHERFPQQFTGVDKKLAFIKKQAVHRADCIIAISDSTRDDLVSILNVPEKKISVIPLASSFTLVSSGTLGRVHDNPYLLYVGLRNEVKNFATLFKAYSHSKQLNTHFDLICVGGESFSASELSAFRVAGIEKKIHHYHADDHKLASLYGNAAVFIYPSLYEGFGLPLLEAMQCGCPVVCSNTSSMPEIAGDAAKYFNPEDEEDLRKTLEDVVGSQETQKMMIQHGSERQKLYTWDKCVEQTAQLYVNLL